MYINSLHSLPMRKVKQPDLKCIYITTLITHITSDIFTLYTLQ